MAARISRRARVGCTDPNIMAGTLNIRIHCVAFFLHFAAVVVVAALGEPWKVYIASSWNDWIESDAPGRDNEVAIVTYYEQCGENACFQVNVKWLVMLFSIISGSHHFIVIMARISKNTAYDDAASNGFNWVRWLDYALSSSLMITVNTIVLKAPADFQTVVPTFLVQFMVCVGGALSEYIWSKGHVAAAQNAFWAFSLPFALLWTSQFYWLAKAGAHSNRDGRDGMPAFVYLYFFVLFLGFCLFPFIHALKTRRFVGCDEGNATKTSKKLPPAKPYGDKTELSIVAEDRYAVASIMAKVPLLLLFAVSLDRADVDFSQGSNVTDNTTYASLGEDTTLYMVAGSSLVGCLIIGVITLKFDKIFCTRRSGCCEAEDMSTVAASAADTPTVTSTYKFLNF